MLDVFAQPAFWASLVLLIGMEVVLSADNFVFISTMASKIPAEHRKKVLRVAMFLAALFRLALLFGVVWILGLERTAFSIAGWAPSWRDLILLAGGLFLVYKAVTELHVLIEPVAMAHTEPMRISESLGVGVAQIVLINAVFSVDSIITAIGLTPYVEAMAIAVVVSVGFLYFAANRLGDVIAAHPAVRGLALGFLLVVGIILVAEGLGLDTVRSYLYGAMFFAVAVLGLSKLARRFSRTAERRSSEPREREPSFDAAPAAAPAAMASSQAMAEPARSVQGDTSVESESLEPPLFLETATDLPDEAPVPVAAAVELERDAPSDVEVDGDENGLEAGPVDLDDERSRSTSKQDSKDGDSKPEFEVIEPDTGPEALFDIFDLDPNVEADPNLEEGDPDRPDEVEGRDDALQRADDEPEVEPETRDDETLGDDARPVPKSRPKRPIQQRRSLRPRTGRRRE